MKPCNCGSFHGLDLDPVSLSIQLDIYLVSTRLRLGFDAISASPGLGLDSDGHDYNPTRVSHQ